MILSLYPWDGIGTQGSPFVMTFERTGIPHRRRHHQLRGADGRAVRATAASSAPRACSTASPCKASPRAFAKVDRNGVRAAPRGAGLDGGAARRRGSSTTVPEKVFVWVTSISTFGAVWTRAVILLAQMQFRRSSSPAQHKALAFRMPFWPYGSWIALAFPPAWWR